MTVPAGRAVRLTLACFAAAALLPPRGVGQDVDSLRAALAQAEGTARLRALADLARELRATDPTASLAYGDQAIALADSVALPQSEIVALTESAWALMELGRYDEATARAELGRARAEAVGDRAGLARALNNLGVVQRRTGGFGLALDYFRRSGDIYGAMGDEAAVATSLNNRSVVHGFDLGDYDRALADQLRVLEIRERLGATGGIYQSYNNLGVIYENLSDLESAEAYLTDALAGWRELDVQPRIASTLENLATVALAGGEHARALQLARESLTIREALGAVSGVAFSLESIGSALLAMGLTDEARPPLTRALATREELGERRAIASSHLALARLERRAGNLGAAARHARMAVQEAQDVAALDLERGAWQELAGALETQGDLAGALDAFRRFKAADDSLFSVQRARRIEALEAEYQADLRQREIERLTIAADLARSRAERSAAFLVVGVLMAIILSLVYRRYVTTQQRRDLERLVAERTSALSNANERLADLSLTDPLTGLRNRRFLTQMIDGEVAAAQRAYTTAAASGGVPANADMIFYLLDIDDFKSINDEHGHATGDLALRHIAQALSATVRASDLLVRWGGEEFLVVSRNTARDDATSFAERLRVSVRGSPIETEAGVTIVPTCSVGFAALPFVPTAAQAIGWELTVAIADQGTYLAKRSGRDAWTGFVATDSTDPEALRGDLEPLRAQVDSGAVAVVTSLTSEGRTLVWSDADAS